MNESLQEVTISFDVFCEWKDTPAVYRVYVDDDLIVERTYIWRNPQQYVREHLVVLLTPGVHYCKTEIINASSDVNFYDHNFDINGVRIEVPGGKFII